LWAATVAERLGHPPETAMSLASAIAGIAARAKARRLGSAEDTAPAREAEADSVVLLGHEVPVTQDAEGRLCAAEPDGTPAPGTPAGNYVRRAFGDRLDEVQSAMRRVADSYAPEELNRSGFRIYESFRPLRPEGAGGRGAKEVLDLSLMVPRDEREG
jgi:hypothetical protein